MTARIRAAPLAVAAVVALLAASRLPSQTPAPTDTVSETRRLRDAGEFTAAAELIAPFAAAHPDSDGVAWLAGQTLYWAQRPRDARPFYDRALEEQPGNAELRVDFGRFLVETGDYSRARDVLHPAIAESTTRARALTWIGTIEYWTGDLRAARRRFREALRADSSLAVARQQLRDIEVAAASSIRGDGGYWHDDQPLDYTAFEGTGTWFADPLTPIKAHVKSRTFDPGTGFETTTFSQGELSVATYLPSAKLELGAAAGMVQRSVSSTRDFTGRLTLGLRLPGHTALRGRAEQAPYTYTVSSLVAEPMVRTFDGTFGWQAPSGWLAEAGARLERFPDDNAIGSAYAWMLAPLVHRPGGDLRAGYGFSFQDAERSRFVPVADVPLPPGQGPVPVAGIYSPYYTPRNLQSHAVLGSANAQLSPRVWWSANGSYGVSAHDDAPLLTARAVPGSPDANLVVRSFARRSFHPWMAHLTLDARLSDDVSVGIAGESGAGAFYEYATAGLHVTWTFTRAAIRRAEAY